MNELNGPKCHYLSQCNREQAFTLVEVLVAILITSFGLLGIAGLVANSLRYNQTAWQRSVATELALDMMDRMRANSFALLNADGTKVTPAPYMTSTLNVNGVKPNRDCTDSTAAACSPTEMANWDWYEWRNNVVNQLPAGQGAVFWDTTGGTKRIRVVLAWTEAGKTDKTWSSALDGSSAADSPNVCPPSAGLNTGTAVRCFQAIFYP
jgi:type IV pilus assembly protein PilV